MDEPAQKMHPNLQGRFLDFIRESARRDNNQFFLITHSPYLIMEEDIQHVWRFHLDNRITRSQNIGQTMEQLDTLDQDKIKLSLRNAEIRALLFSRGVVLVEGPSDKIVVEKTDAYAARTGKSADIVSKEWSVIVAGSKSSFPTFFKLCKALGLPRIAIADSDALMRIERTTNLSTGQSQLSSLLLALHTVAELTLEEEQIITKNSQSLISNEKDSYFEPKCREAFQKIVESHHIFTFKIDPEAALGIDVSGSGRKPMKALDEMVARIEDGNLPDELNELASFLKSHVDLF